MCWHNWFDYPSVVFLIAGLIPGNNSLIEQIQYYTACNVYIMDLANILPRIIIPAWYWCCSTLEDFVVTQSEKCGVLIILSARIRFRTNESSDLRSPKIWRWCDDIARNPNIFIFGRIFNVQKQNDACVTYELVHLMVYCMQREANIWISESIMPYS